MSRSADLGAYRLVVFDWDGTLIDSIGAIVDCTYAMLDELGLPSLPRDEILALIGRGLDESVDALAPEGDETIRRRIVETYSRLWFADFHARGQLIAGARRAVDRLAASGALLAVATAKSRRGLTSDLERTGVADLFHASRTPNESRPKPHPDMLLEILEELGVRPNEALMVGDSVHDLDMARNAGVPVVAVSSGAQTEATLRRRTPLACLGSVAELPEWLGLP
ncbi:MAG: HAD-IA family hydrolase [Thermoanaerobaculia bacterium]|nr:HAD-IA family hydrolase [Thermoanaerobaculia bacterium]